jgi:hypothetical protein
VSSKAGAAGERVGNEAAFEDRLDNIGESVVHHAVAGGAAEMRRVLDRSGGQGERRDIAVGQTGDRQRISGKLRRKSKSGPGLRALLAHAPQNG